MHFFGSPVSTPSPIKGRNDLLDSLRSNDGKAVGLPERDGDQFGFVDALPGVQVSQFTGYADYLKAGTKRVWASARAVDLTANVILSTEMKVIARDTTKGKAPLKADPELLRLLQNPNPYDTISEMLYLVVAHLKFTGNAYWLKDQMNGYGQPKAIYTLNPKNVVIVPDRVTKIKKYIYRVNGAEIDLAPEEVIHFKRPHADDSLLGIGEIENAESLFDDYINRALHSANFFKNGAIPSGVLVREDFSGSQDDWNRIRDSWTEKYTGQRNTGKVAWLNGKWSLLQMGLDASKMQDLEKSKRNIEEIFIAHGVPLSVAGFGAANYATSRQDDIGFRRYTCKPLLELICDALNSPHGLVPAFHKDGKLDFSLSGLIDVEQVMKEASPLFDRGGLTPNDMRELSGLQRVLNPLLDQYYIPASYVPLEIAGIATEPSAPPPPASAPKPPEEKPKPEAPKPNADGEKPDSADVEDSESPPPKRISALQNR